MQTRYFLIMLMVLALFPSGASRKILIDYGHGERFDQPFSTEKSQPCLDLFEDTYEITPFFKPMTYKNLQDYDVLIVCSPQRSFEQSEIGAITRFISNGGGMLVILGSWVPDYTELGPINSLSEPFGVQFTDQGLLRTSLTIEIEGQNHPVLQDVKKISFNCPNFINIESPSKELVHSEEREDSLVAYCEYDKGRIIFLPSSTPFVYPHVQVFDNEQFIKNVFSWLSEPGGPYLQQKETREKGLALLEKGKEQIESGNYSSAKSTLMQAKNYLESTLTDYESDTTETTIGDIEILIKDCEEGIRAETLLSEGKSLYESGEYMSAVSTLQEAQQLFQSIHADTEECVTLINECNSKIEIETNIEKAETYMREGISYFGEQQYKLAKDSFLEAIALFTALEDRDKIVECEEWIISCEEALTPESSRMPVEIIAGAAGLVGVGAAVLVLRSRKRMNKDTRGEIEKKEGKVVTPSGLSRKTVCPFCKKEIEEDWISCPYCGVRLRDDTQVYE